MEDKEYYFPLCNIYIIQILQINIRQPNSNIKQNNVSFVIQGYSGMPAQIGLILVRAACVRCHGTVSQKFGETRLHTGESILLPPPLPYMCSEIFSLVSMEGWAEGQSCTDPGARTPIGASGNYSSILTCYLYSIFSN